MTKSLKTKLLLTKTHQVTMSKKERLVAAIENGTVIDHIPSEKTYEVANILGLQNLNTVVTIGYNYLSKKSDEKE